MYNLGIAQHQLDGLKNEVDRLVRKKVEIDINIKDLERQINGILTEIEDTLSSYSVRAITDNVMLARGVDDDTEEA